jgi:hypothetical protein
MSKDRMVRFIEFDEDNPHIYELFKKFAFTLIHLGHSKCSANTIYDRVRWHIDMETDNPPHEEEKMGSTLKGGYGSFYARMFMREFPEHGGLFRCRKTFIYEREFDQRLQRIFEDREAA